MYFWWIAQKDILLYLRDRRALLLTIAMPLLLIGILGAAFSNLFANTDDQAFSPFEVGIVNLDEGSLGKSLAVDLLGTGLQDVIHARYMDESTLVRQLDAQELSIGIIIRPDFTTSIFMGSMGSVELHSNYPSSIQLGIVESIIHQFGQTVQVNQEAGVRLYQRLAHESTLDDLGVAQIEARIADMMVQQMSSIEQDMPLLHIQGVHTSDRPVGAFQYYAAGMGVMFLLMAVVQGVGAMIEEKESPVIHRLLLTNMTHRDYVFGKLIGLLFANGIQMAVIILGTRLLFGVYWGDSLFGVLIVAIAFVVSASGLGVFFGSFIQKSRTLTNTGMILVQMMAALGGSMVPLYMYPDWLNALAKVLPNALALQSFLELMTGANWTQVWGASATLFGIGLLFLLLGWLKLNRDRRVRYA